MRKSLLLFFLSLVIRSLAFGAAPTVPSSNLTFNSLDGAQFSANYTVGNGSYRIVVMKEGSPVTGVPVNGVEYNANSSFGAAGSQFTAPGEFVVARTSWSTFSATNLQPGTTYYVAIFEYNGTAAAAQYLSLPLTGSQSTVIAPTMQTTSILSTGTTGNTLSFSWTKGNGSGRLILARKASLVNASPTDLTNYWSDPIFGNGTQVGTGNFVVYKGTGTSVTVKNLEPNTTYHFAVFEYNGLVSPMHLLPGASFSATTSMGPSVAPSSPGFNYVEGNRYTIAVNQGNGTRRLFIARKNAPVTSLPVNGTTYAANASFGTAGTEIAPGEFVVAATTGNSVSVSSLEPNTTYHFRVFEYDVDNAGNPYYLTSTYAVKSGSTSTTPTTIGSNLNIPTLTGSTATINMTIGNGSYRMVIMKAGGPVDAVPADLSKYTANSSFGNGAQITPGNYVMFSGINGNQFTVSNLQPGVTYHTSVYEFNGSDAPVYSATGAVINFTVPLQPTAASTAPWTSLVDGASFRLIWTNGNGAKRLVVARKTSAVSAKPVDQINYTANAGFGLGEQIAPGEFVVYSGTANNVDLTGLEFGTTYHFAVYEYNVGPDGKPDYFITSWLAANGATLGWPTSQPVITSVTAIQATQATINFTKGNGANRIFIMKQGSPVNVEPQDLVKYNYNGNFGSASAHISDGNYVVLTTGGQGSLTPANLVANTTYYVSAFEYNGSNEPAYLRASPATISFTTADVPGATVPTIAASAPLVTGVDGNKFTFKWTVGNGEKRIVIARQGSAVSFIPSNATTYTANANFGTGTDLGNGQFVVYSGNGTSVDVTNLSPSSNYFFAVYEFNGTGSLLRYLTSSFLAGSGSTLFAPATQSSSVVSSTANGQISLSWNAGNGSGRLVVLKENSPVTCSPADLGIYPASTTFGSGSQLALGEYVVYSGSGNSVTVTGLANKTYYFRIFEYNGSAAPVYNITTPASGSAIVSGSLPVRFVSFTTKPSTAGITLNWTTSFEQNSASFFIERSSDGNIFQSVGSVAAAGNSSTPRNYVFTDRVNPDSKVFYRLKQTDLDGRSAYSAIVAVDKANSAMRLETYPNPAGSFTYLRLPAGRDRALIEIYNSNGQLVKHAEFSNGQKIDCSSWTPGLYYLKYNEKDRVLSTTIFKQ